jgi:hypothetical protein
MAKPLVGVGRQTQEHMQRGNYIMVLIAYVFRHAGHIIAGLECVWLLSCKFPSLNYLFFIAEVMLCVVALCSPVNFLL